MNRWMWKFVEVGYLHLLSIIHAEAYTLAKCYQMAEAKSESEGYHSGSKLSIQH